MPQAHASTDGAVVKRRYWLFALPATVVVAAVIVFPWLFTIYMSVNDWNVSGAVTFVGLDNFRALFTDQRFYESVFNTLYFTVLAVVLPILLGTAAALVFHRKFKGRGLLRGRNSIVGDTFFGAPSS